ncbi:MAG: sporulation initiation factor Spo0A C-terminal domain-containing protein [Clostridiales bacterium]|nr:sporulation initiation factor Spo0A C-terminal domain-containing protein [Clostridiales bacterium]
MSEFQKFIHFAITAKNTEETDKIINELIDNENITEIVGDDNEIIKTTSYPQPKIYIEHVNIEAEKIFRLLMKLGLMPNHIGFHYTVTAIGIRASIDGAHFYVTKDVYQYLAKRFRATPARIERCIRKSIEFAWANGGAKAFDEILGLDFAKRPTNAQFITIVAEYIKENRDTYYSPVPDKMGIKSGKK